MSKAETAVNLFKGGYSCSQAILATYGPEQGINRDLAVKLASGFGGGMGMGETCGAVTACFMILGLDRAGNESQKPQGRADAKAAVMEFAARFKALRGTVMCRELLGCDISTGPGMEQARKQGLIATVCPKVMQDAAELLEQMLK